VRQNLRQDDSDRSEGPIEFYEGKAQATMSGPFVTFTLTGVEERGSFLLASHRSGL
jgi:hypothetical protein